MVPFYVTRIKKEKPCAIHMTKTIKEVSNICTAYISADCLPRMTDIADKEKNQLTKM